VRDVHPLYVAAVGIVGAAAGASLDPLGQRLADLSRAADDRRRAARQARLAEDAAAEGPDASPVSDGSSGAGAVPAAGTTPSVPELPAPQHDHEPVISDGTAAPAEPGPVPVRHLLPSGHSTPRMAGAAVVTGGLWAAAALRFGQHLVVMPFLVFLALGVVVSVTDLSHRLIPRKLLYAAVALILPLEVIVSAVDDTWHAVLLDVIGGASAYAALFLVWFFAPYFRGNAMGFGDVNLSGVIGLTVGYLGLVHVYLAFLSGFVIGLVFGLVFAAVSGTGRKTYFPFGPSLCAGAVVAIFWGGTLAEHVFHTSS